MDWGATLTGRRLVHQEEETDGLHADVLSFSAGLYNRWASFLRTREHVCLSSNRKGGGGAAWELCKVARQKMKLMVDMMPRLISLVTAAQWFAVGKHIRYQNCGSTKGKSVLLNDGGNMSERVSSRPSGAHSGRCAFGDMITRRNLAAGLLLGGQHRPGPRSLRACAGHTRSRPAARGSTARWPRGAGQCAAAS